MDKHVQDRLVEHYTLKYSANPSSGDTVPRKRYPTNRMEATVKYVGSGKRVLEIGAGGGEIIRTLRSSYESWVATDISQPRVKALTEEFKDDPAVQILNHNIERERLPFKDNYFDMVLLIDIIEHIIDPIVALAEIHRTLTPQGRLIINTPNIAKWTRRIKLLFGYFPATAGIWEGLCMYDGKTPTDLLDEGHLHYFTFRSLTRLLKERIGFTQVIHQGWGVWPLSRLWPAMFSDVFVIAVK